MRLTHVVSILLFAFQLQAFVGVASAETFAAETVNPSAGIGSRQNFTAVYSYTGGAANITDAAMTVTANILDVTAQCMTNLAVSQRRIYLSNDAGTGWVGSVEVGALDTVENSRCVLFGAGSRVDLVNNTLTVTFALAFKPSFSGAKLLYLLAFLPSGTNTGWQQRGGWTVPASAAITAEAVNPSSGSGARQNFTAVFWNAAGATGISDAALTFTVNILDVTSQCMVNLAVAQGRIYLSNDAGTGWVGSVAVGSYQTVENSRCVLYGNDSRVMASGGVLTVTYALAFKPVFAGAKSLYLLAFLPSGANTGWQQRGSWTAQAGAIISAQAVTPSSGSGSRQDFTAIYHYTGGAANIAYASLAVTANILDVTSQCMVNLAVAQGRVYLSNDAGTGSAGSVVLGSAEIVENSRCILFGSGSMTSSGSTLTVTYALAFKPSFAGAKSLYLLAFPSSGPHTGWQQRGEWTIPSSATITAETVSPSSGIGPRQNFTAIYTYSAGGTVISDAALTVADDILDVTDQCMVNLAVAQGRMYLSSDTGTGWAGSVAVGSSETVENGLCVLLGSESRVNATGSILSVTYALAFKPAFVGAKSIYLLAFPPAGPHTGWQQRGAWSVPPLQARDVLVQPTDIAFWMQAIGTTGERQVTVTNTTSYPLVAMHIEPMRAPFSQVNNCGTELPPGQTCTITIRYTPTVTYVTGEGGVSLGSVPITSGSAQLGKYVVSVFGRGGVAPVVLVDPYLPDLYLGFPDTRLGTAVSKTVKVVNAGNAVAIFQAPRIIGDDPADFSVTTCPNLNPGQTCTMTVRFQPRGLGTRSAELDILSNGLEGTSGVRLAGFGIP